MMESTENMHGMCKYIIWLHDNQLAESDETAAACIVEVAEMEDWINFFTNEEMEKGITKEMIQEARQWIFEHYNYKLSP